MIVYNSPFFAWSLSFSKTQHPLKTTDLEGNHRNTLSTVSAITSASFFAAPESTKDGSVMPDGFDIGTGFKNNSHSLDWHAAFIIPTAFSINRPSTSQPNSWIIAETSPEPERVTDVPPHPDTNTPRIISPMTRFLISDSFSNADNCRGCAQKVSQGVIHLLPCQGRVDHGTWESVFQVALKLRPVGRGTHERNHG